MPTAQLSIRQAGPSDVPIVLGFIRDLAEYERLSHEVVATEEDLHEHLFGEHRTAEAVLGYLGDEAVAFALFFHNFSTFLGRPGIYLEDLFVRPSARGLGIGRAMLRYVAQLACERKCGRVEWSVLDWNEPAIGFYRSLGAIPKDEWTIYRLTGDALQRFAVEGELR